MTDSPFKALGGPAIIRMNDLMDVDPMPMRSRLIAVLEGHAKLDEAIRAFSNRQDEVSCKLAASAGRLMNSAMPLSREIQGKVLAALKDGFQVHWDFDELEDVSTWSFDDQRDDARRVLNVFVHAPRTQQCPPLGTPDPDAPECIDL
jgi:hypothetical protein